MNKIILNKERIKVGGEDLRRQGSNKQYKEREMGGLERK